MMKKSLELRTSFGASTSPPSSSIQKDSGPVSGDNGSTSNNGGEVEDWTASAVNSGGSVLVKKKTLLDKYEKVLWTRKIDGPCLIQHTLPFEKERCALWHSNEDRRRDPRRQGPQGPINRAPWVYSNHHAEGGTMNYVELAYHPQNFKTLKCNEFASTGKCPRFEYCPRRHIYNGVDYDADYVPPPLLPILPESEFRKLMSSYKVQGPCPVKCDLVPTNKPPWLHCPYFHGKIETSIDIRRALQVNKETGEWIPTLKAATSKLEYSYHPERFKMEPCLHFNTKGYCAREYTCSFYHGEEEYYKIGEYFERLKNDLLTKGKIEIYEDPPIDEAPLPMQLPVGGNDPSDLVAMGNMGNIGLVDEYGSEYPMLQTQNMLMGSGSVGFDGANNLDAMHSMMMNNMMAHNNYSSSSSTSGNNMNNGNSNHPMSNFLNSPSVGPKNNHASSRLPMAYNGMEGNYNSSTPPNNGSMAYVDNPHMYNSNSNNTPTGPGSLFYGNNNVNLLPNVYNPHNPGASNNSPNSTKQYSPANNVNNGNAPSTSYNINSVPNIYNVAHMNANPNHSAPLSSSPNYYSNFGSNLFDVFSSGSTNYSQFYPSSAPPTANDYSSPSLRTQSVPVTSSATVAASTSSSSISPESRSPPLPTTTSPIPSATSGLADASNQGSPLYSLLLECGISPDKAVLYSRLLLDNDIDSNMLLSNAGEINYSTLEKVGITSVGHQIKIMRLGRLGRLGSSAPGSDVSTDFQKLSVSESGYPLATISPPVSSGVKEDDNNGLVFNKQQPVGENQYSILYKGSLNNTSVSIKKLKKGYKYRDDRTDYQDCVNTLSKLRHKHLLQFFGLHDTEGTTYLVTEFMDNNLTLESLLISHKRSVASTLSLHTLLSMAAQSAEAMQYLVEQQVIHGDLCASNIMVGNNHSIKVCDFGISQMITTNATSGSESSTDNTLIRYSHAPLEVLRLPQHNNWILESSDVWSFGVLLWEMFEPGSDPYLGIPNEEIHLFLESGQRLNQPDQCPDSLYQLMYKCWQMEPTYRPSFYSLRSQLIQIAASDEEEGKNMSPVYRNQDFTQSLWDE